MSIFFTSYHFTPNTHYIYTGDFINAELLGGVNTTMIGNVIQTEYLTNNDYPEAAALSFLLMFGILVAVAIYARVLGTEELTG